MPTSSVPAKIFDVLLHQRGAKDLEIRAASLSTLNDNDLLSVAALFWTQIGWVWVLATTGWLWAVGFSLLDATLFVTRWRMRRGRGLLGRSIGSGAELLFTAVNIGLMGLVSICIFALSQTPSDRASILAIILAVGFSGYAAALFTAFTVLATINIAFLYAALGIGLTVGPSDLTRPFALLTPCAAAAFWLLTQHTHQTLLLAIRSQRDNRRLSLQDPLTRLPNRIHMREALEQRIVAIGAEGGPTRVAVLGLDLDGFKAINDRHGHAAGDWVLVHVADILRAHIGGGDLACRIGGDEFVLVLYSADEERIASLGKTIIRAVEEPFDIGRTIPARIGVSIGVAVADNPSCEIDAILEDADSALYMAKREGRGRICYGSKSGHNMIDIAASRAAPALL